MTSGTSWTSASYIGDLQLHHCIDVGIDAAANMHCTHHSEHNLSQALVGSQLQPVAMSTITTVCDGRWSRFRHSSYLQQRDSEQGIVLMAR